MTSTGTYAFSLSSGEVVLDAYERCGMVAAMLERRAGSHERYAAQVNMGFGKSAVVVPMLVLALICAWVARRDLDSGTTKWFAWARLATPVTRAEKPVRYWLAMGANIGVLLLFTLVGVFAMRAGALRFGPR
jgi:uncharacterized membrane protein YhaH (DUF805 family)